MGLFPGQEHQEEPFRVAAQNGGSGAARLAEEAKRYDREAEELRLKAEGLERDVDHRMEEAERRERRHHVLTVAVTLLHVAIAVTTIAIVLRGSRWPWRAGLALGAAGVATAAYAYL